MKTKYYVIYDKVANLYYQGSCMWATDIEFGERYKTLKSAKLRHKDIKALLNDIDLSVLKVKIKEIKL